MMYEVWCPYKPHRDYLKEGLYEKPENPENIEAKTAEEAVEAWLDYNWYWGTEETKVLYVRDSVYIHRFEVKPRTTFNIKLEEKVVCTKP